MHLISITSLISLSFSRLSFASPHLIHPILRSPAPFDPVVPCLPPLFFQLRYFSTFVPGDENLLPRLSVISFIFADLGTGITTLCSHTLQNDEVRNGILLADPWHFLPCGDSRVAFLWDGARLQVLEDRGCGLPGMALGSIKPPLVCYPVGPPFPYGHGTVCDSAPAEVPVYFTSTYEG